MIMKARLILLLLTFFVCFDDPGVLQADVLRLNATYGATSVAYAPFFVAKETKIFEKHGLDVQLIFIQGALGITALIANEADVIGIGGTSTILANLKGADTVIIGSIENILGFQLITLPSISKPADLIGKPLGISTFGSTSDFALREMVRRAGIDPEKITIVPVGDLATRLGAVQSGRIVGSIFIPPSSSVATKAGLKVLLDSSKLGIPFQGSGITTLRRTIERSPEKLRRFMKEYIEGLYLFKTNKTLALRMISRVTGQQDPEALEVAYDYYVNLYPQVPYPTKEGIRTVLDFLAPTTPAARNASPESFIDVRFIQELERDGFIANLNSVKGR
jgi:ABC-type nitrate/sulfonate/bicarbonate transport system substrate-binding protein